MKTRHVLIIISSIILILITYFIGSACYELGISYGEQNAEDIRKKREIETDNDSIEPKFVKTILIKNGTIPFTISSFGRVVSSTSINLSTEVQGKISGLIPLKKGSEFSKDQVIVNVDSKDALLALNARKSNYLNIISLSLPDLLIDFSDQYEKWSNFFNSIDVEKDLPNFPDFSNSKEKNFIITRNILSEYYNIKSDEARFNKYTITAPFDGSIVEAYTDNGAIINPGSPIIKIIRKGKLEIEIPITVQNKEYVQIGDTVFLNENNIEFEGTITRIGEFVNPNTQNLSVYVNINKLNENILYDGMYLEAIITCAGIDNVAEIPRRAVFDEKSIYTVNKDLQLNSIQIDIKATKENTFLVTGLSDSTRIVVEPVINAKKNMEVSIELDQPKSNP